MQIMLLFWTSALGMAEMARKYIWPAIQPQTLTKNVDVTQTAMELIDSSLQFGSNIGRMNVAISNVYLNVVRELRGFLLSPGDEPRHLFPSIITADFHTHLGHCEVLRRMQTTALGKEMMLMAFVRAFSNLQAYLVRLALQQGSSVDLPRFVKQLQEDHKEFQTALAPCIAKLTEIVEQNASEQGASRTGANERSEDKEGMIDEANEQDEEKEDMIDEAENTFMQFYRCLHDLFAAQFAKTAQKVGAPPQQITTQQNTTQQITTQQITTQRAAACLLTQYFQGLDLSGTVSLLGNSDYKTFRKQFLLDCGWASTDQFQLEDTDCTAFTVHFSPWALSLGFNIFDNGELEIYGRVLSRMTRAERSRLRKENAAELPIEQELLAESLDEVLCLEKHRDGEAAATANNLTTLWTEMNKLKGFGDLSWMLVGLSETCEIEVADVPHLLKFFEARIAAFELIKNMLGPAKLATFPRIFYNGIHRKYKIGINQKNRKCCTVSRDYFSVDTSDYAGSPPEKKPKLENEEGIDQTFLRALHQDQQNTLGLYYTLMCEPALRFRLSKEQKQALARDYTGLATGMVGFPAITMHTYTLGKVTDTDFWQIYEIKNIQYYGLTEFLRSNTVREQFFTVSLDTCEAGKLCYVFTARAKLVTFEDGRSEVQAGAIQLFVETCSQALGNNTLHRISQRFVPAPGSREYSREALLRVPSDNTVRPEPCAYTIGHRRSCKIMYSPIYLDGSGPCVSFFELDGRTGEKRHFCSYILCR